MDKFLSQEPVLCSPEWGKGRREFRPLGYWKKEGRGGKDVKGFASRRNSQYFLEK